MTSTERKRTWRLRHPERSAQAERERAQARRDGIWGPRALGVPLRLCASHESYWRHENTEGRMRQRLFYPRYGAGAHHMTSEELKAASAALVARAAASTGSTPKRRRPAATGTRCSSPARSITLS